MTSTRLGALFVAIILATCIGGGSCAKNNNAQLAELQVELRAEREFLRQTRAELQAMMTRLEPLLAMIEPMEAAMSEHVVELPTPSAAPMPTEDAAGGATKVDASNCIAKTGPTDYRISRTCFEALLGNPFEMTSGARIVPSIQNGQGNGFKVYAIRANSIFALLGLENGDTVRRVNGVELSSMDKTMELYTNLGTATRIDMELTRRDKPITLRYSIP